MDNNILLTGGTGKLSNKIIKSVIFSVCSPSQTNNKNDKSRSRDALLGRCDFSYRMYNMPSDQLAGLSTGRIHLVFIFDKCFQECQEPPELLMENVQKYCVSNSFA